MLMQPIADEEDWKRKRRDIIAAAARQTTRASEEASARYEEVKTLKQKLEAAAGERNAVRAQLAKMTEMMAEKDKIMVEKDKQIFQLQSTIFKQPMLLSQGEAELKSQNEETEGKLAAVQAELAACKADAKATEERLVQQYSKIVADKLQLQSEKHQLSVQNAELLQGIQTTPHCTQAPEDDMNRLLQRKLTELTDTSSKLAAVQKECQGKTNEIISKNSIISELQDKVGRLNDQNESLQVEIEFGQREENPCRSCGGEGGEGEGSHG